MIGLSVAPVFTHTMIAPFRIFVLQECTFSSRSKHVRLLFIKNCVTVKAKLICIGRVYFFSFSFFFFGDLEGS